MEVLIRKGAGVRGEVNESALKVVAESVFLVYLSKTAWSSSRLSMDYTLLDDLLEEAKKRDTPSACPV